MKNPNSFTWRCLSIAGALVLAMTLSSGATAGKQRDKDDHACGEMGTSHGSPGYTHCMLQQQQRRDQKMSVFLEQQLMHQELGRPAREKLEQKRARRAREKWENEQQN